MGTNNRIQACLDSLTEIEQLVAQPHVREHADRICELASSIFRQAPHAGIGELAMRLRDAMKEERGRRLTTYVRYLRDELEAVKADSRRQWVSPAVDQELRIAELEEETGGLRAGLTHLEACLEACTTLLDLVVRRTNLDPDEALKLAKAIDLEVEKALTLRRKDDDPGLAWLRRVRDDLITWYKLEPSLRQARAHGRIRAIPPRDRLQVIDGSQEKPPDQRTGSQDPERDE